MGAALALLASGAPPIALGAESAAEGGSAGTAIAIVSAVSLVVGYLLLFALWRYVFSAKARARRREPPD
jgi:hypothetical protein